MEMRKRVWAALLALCLLIVCAGVPAYAESPEEVLTAEPWKSTSGATLTLNADGSAVLSSNMDIEGTWSYAEPTMTFTYELYGTRTLELILEQKDGVWQLHTEDGQGLYLPESQADEAAAAANAGLNAYPIELGTPITLPFATITFDHAEVCGIVGVSETGHAYRTAPDGMRFMALMGTIENTSNIELKAEQIRGEIVFDNNYTYSAAAHADTVATNTRGFGVLAPLTSCDYCVYAAIPESLVGNFSTCRVTFAFNENFAKTPNYMADGDFAFTVELNEEASAAAQEGPVRELTYFEECPILPVPTSYADVNQSGYSSSSSNGKTTRINYTYRALLSGDSIADLCDQYLAALRETGYTVSEGAGETTVSANGTLLVTITLDGDSMKLDIKPGNEGLSALPTPSADGAEPAAEPEPETPALHLGDTIAAHTAEVTLESLTTTDTIYSDLSGTASWYHYVESESGDPLLAAFGTFRNTGTEPVDVWNTYAAFVIDGTYSYRADVYGVRKGAEDFIRDVSPLSSTQICVYGEVPQSVIDNAHSIVLKLGFTDHFTTKVTSSGSLPLFDRCDEVFEIELKEGVSADGAATSAESVVYTDKETVKKVQQALNDAGYDCGTPDGIAGKKTESAIKAFQAANGLEQTGVIDDQLLEALGLSH